MSHRSTCLFRYLTPLVVLGAALLGAPITAAAGEEITVSTPIPVGAYQVKGTDKGHELAIDGYGRLLVPGMPNLPAKIFAIAIPPGAELIDVSYDAGEGIVLPGTYAVPPVPLPRVIGEEDPAVRAKEQARYDENYAQVYGSDNPYPQQTVWLERTAGYRKYNLVDVRVAPFTYSPASGQLIYHPEITVHVRCALSDRSGSGLVDNLPRTERIAEEIIVNYKEAAEWYPKQQSCQRGLYDFVIITLDSLTSTVTPLVNWETYKGRNVAVVTTSWIDANYTDDDLAAEIRAFLREKYPSGEWGIEDVLLIGDYDDVPMRRCAQDLGYGEPETDFYYAELSLDDEASWDDDNDGLYGENSDTIDFYNEVNVGRIPWSGAATVANICQKSVAFEQNDDPSFKKNILLLGAYFWADTDNAVLMEAKVDQPWMSDWTMTRMYEKNTDYYSSYACDYELLRSNVMAVWPSGTYAFVNWAGHGSPTSCHIYGLGAPAFIASSDCSSLNDDYPAIIFADACSNSDTDNLNIGKAMLQQGAVGFVGATKVALGCPGWSGPGDGSSQSLDYYFTTAVTSGDYTQGQAHQNSLRQMYTYGLWSYLYYETFEWGALWGNPNLGMAPPPNISISFPDGLPDVLTPGQATDITVRISEGVEAYVADSGTLYYRYDGGTYLTSPLVPQGGDLYQATLPAAGCNDTPEYYFSAEGTVSGVIYSPTDAPTSVYTADVGEYIVVWEDDFETDKGWSVYAGADTGNWERADPQEVDNSGTITQPEDDHTPSGTMCFVTGPLAGSGAGSYDVDGGPTRVISPVLDLEGLDAKVSYWRWYHISTEWDDEFKVQVNNGSDWVLVESITNRETWTYAEWKVSDYVTPTSTVQVRFVASDNPNNSLVEALVDDFKVEAFTCDAPYDVGDVNCDGAVNGFDIDPFVMVVGGDLTGYYALYPDCDHMLADANNDGEVNGFDIDPFINLVGGG